MSAVSLGPECQPEKQIDLPILQQEMEVSGTSSTPSSGFQRTAGIQHTPITPASFLPYLLILIAIL